jgi:hypothetical protein
MNRVFVVIVRIAIGSVNGDVEGIGALYQSDARDFTLNNPRRSNRWKFHTIDIRVRSENTQAIDPSNSNTENETLMSAMNLIGHANSSTVLGMEYPFLSSIGGYKGNVGDLDLSTPPARRLPFSRYGLEG